MLLQKTAITIALCLSFTSFAFAQMSAKSITLNYSDTESSDLTNYSEESLDLKYVANNEIKAILNSGEYKKQVALAVEQLKRRWSENAEALNLPARNFTLKSVMHFNTLNISVENTGFKVVAKIPSAFNNVAQPIQMTVITAFTDDFDVTHDIEVEVSTEKWQHHD